MKTHEERLENLFFFAKDVLGYDELTELHLSWFDTLLRHRHLLLLAPPGHYKSTVCTIAYPLFRLTEDNNMRILLVNEVLENSKGFLREIKGHIQQNERFREKFGNWDMTADAWTEERILIPRTQIRKEPSMAVASVLGTVVSVHPDLIVIDDPCSNRNTMTAHQRQKVINWFQRDLLPRLDDGGQILIVMTRWNVDDMAGWIMNNPGFDDWKVINLASEWTDEKNQRHILFPQKFNEKKLDRLKARLGTPAYNCLYLNDPSGQDGAEVKAAWIDSARYDKPPEDLTQFAGMDLAISEKEKGSRSAYCVIGRDKDGTLYVLDSYRDRIHFDEQLKTVKRVCRVHPVRLMLVEANAYESAFVQSLRTDPETRHLPIKAVRTTGDKDARIRGLIPLFENGILRLPRPEAGLWVSHLEEELFHFPNGTKDMLDALWLAIEGVQIQRTEPKIVFAEDESMLPEKREKPSEQEIKDEAATCPVCWHKNVPEAMKCAACGHCLRCAE
ncbi:MAG: phage terminase large subunit [Elusimicrobia bacterium]|nr:phage terminase large subunit [Elusimicrobiota bacterium]